MKLIKNCFAIALAIIIVQPTKHCSAVPRPGGVYENSINSTAFTEERQVIRGKFSKDTKITFTTQEGQEIIFPVTKFSRSNGKSRLNFLVPSLGVKDINGNSLTASSNDLFSIVGKLGVFDDRLISGRQFFDLIIYIQPNQISENVFISSTVNGQTDSIFRVERLSL
jgi:hypothetical protein